MRICITMWQCEGKLTLSVSRVSWSFVTDAGANCLGTALASWCFGVLSRRYIWEAGQEYTTDDWLRDPGGVNLATSLSPPCSLIASQIPGPASAEVSATPRSARATRPLCAAHRHRCSTPTARDLFHHDMPWKTVPEGYMDHVATRSFLLCSSFCFSLPASFL